MKAQLPVNWRRWPRPAKVEYARATLSRRELYQAIADEARFDPRDVSKDPRLRVHELAAIYVELGGPNR